MADFETLDIAEGGDEGRISIRLERSCRVDRKDREIRRTVRMALAEVQAGAEYEVLLELSAEQMGIRPAEDRRPGEKGKRFLGVWAKWLPSPFGRGAGGEGFVES